MLLGEAADTPGEKREKKTEKYGKGGEEKWYVRGGKGKGIKIIRG